MQFIEEYSKLICVIPVFSSNTAIMLSAWLEMTGIGLLLLIMYRHQLYLQCTMLGLRLG